MSGPVVVVNPNSNPAVTAGISAALAGFRLPGAPEFACLTLEEGPFGIESQADSDAVIAPLARLAAARADAAAFVIACFSDPGLAECREATGASVFGIRECGVLAALARAERFGIVSLSEGSTARRRPHLERIGVAGRLAGERAIGMSVAEAEASPEAPARIEAAGRALAAAGAGAIVLGCAGMAGRRATLERALGLPVIDPCQAAAGMALAAALARTRETD